MHPLACIVISALLWGVIPATCDWLTQRQRKRYADAHSATGSCDTGDTHGIEIMLTKDQIERAFEEAMNVARELAKGGSMESDVVAGAKAVIAAAHAVEAQFDAKDAAAQPVARITGNGQVHILDHNVPVGTLLRRA